jgi:anti-sigma B factor antagonist
MQSRLAINTSSDEDILTAELQGVLDGHTTPDFERFIASDIVATHKHVIFDLAQLSYVASAGIGVLISAQQGAKTRGGTVVLVRPTAGVNEVFNLLGLHALFTIHGDIDSAKDAISD